MSPTPLGALQEICLVTPCLNTTLTALSPLLPKIPIRIYTFSPTTVRDMTYRGQPASYTLRVAFATHGPLVFEIMQPVSGPSLMADYLAAHGGQPGIQHVAFDMAGERDGRRMSMDERVAWMAAKGVGVGMSGTWIGKRGTCEFKFFDTEEKGVGTCFETIEFSEDWEDPDGELWVAEEAEIDGNRD